MRIAASLLFLLCGAAIAAPAAEAPAPAPTTAAADPVFAHPAATKELDALLGPAARALGGAAAVRGAFSQRKFLRELPQPLTSSGEFLVARGTGIDWHTQAPFDSDLVLTPQAMVQRDGGAEAMRVDASTQPGLGAVEQVFDALFALDMPKLAERFTLYGLRGKDGWTLGLKPRDAALAKMIDTVVISGSEQPQRIVLHEINGDRTEISFSRQSALASLSEADRQRFK